MILTLNSILLVLLAIIMYQDIKDKEVTLLVLLSLIVTGGLLHFLQQNYWVFLVSLLVNTLLIGIVLLFIYLYAKFKMKVSLPNVLGMGDILFFLFLGFSFPTASFSILFSVSLLFSLSLSVLIKSKENLVPLAGYQSVFLLLVLVVNHLFKFVNLYSV